MRNSLNARSHKGPFPFSLSCPPLRHQHQRKRSKRGTLSGNELRRIFLLLCAGASLLIFWLIFKLRALLASGEAVATKIAKIRAGGSEASYRRFVERVGAASSLPSPSVLVAISVGNAAAKSVAQQIASFQGGWQQRRREAMWESASRVQGTARGVGDKKTPHRAPGLLREWGLVGGVETLSREDELARLSLPPTIRVVFLVNGFAAGAVEAVRRELGVVGGVKDPPLVVFSEVPGLKHRFWESELAPAKRKKLAEDLLQEDDFQFVWTLDADVIFSPVGGFDVERFVFGSAASGAYVSQPVISSFAPGELGVSKTIVRGPGSLSKTCCSWQRGTDFPFLRVENVAEREEFPYLASRSVPFCEMMAPLFRPKVIDAFLKVESEASTGSTWGLDHLYCAVARTLARDDYEKAKEMSTATAPVRGWPFGLNSHAFSFGTGLAGAADSRWGRAGWAKALEMEAHAGRGAGRGCVLLESSVMVHKDSRSLTEGGSSVLSAARTSLGIAPQGRKNEENWKAMRARWKWIEQNNNVPFSSDRGGDVFDERYGKRGDERGMGRDGPGAWKRDA